MKGILILAGFFFFNCSASFGQAVQKKLSADIITILKNARLTDEVTVLVSVKNVAELKKEKNITIRDSYGNAVLLSVKVSLLSLLLENNNVEFISGWHQPKEELTTGAVDLSLNKINLVHNNDPLYNGNTVLVSVKEQRFDTTDIDWKGRYVNAGTAASTESIHASIMATIIGGGGNSSPFAKGVAWGSQLASSDFTTLLPDANAVYINKNISVQNHSYGTGIENFYGADAAAYDASVYNIPTLVHVFSAGNSGNVSASSGAYSGIQNFANLTGSFKMAKNVITVGHVDSVNTVQLLSSRGPAYDGRIKPELVAFGEDGSSGAAALVSGTAALLQQAYKTSHNNQYPTAALLKAILINGADDIGSQGPDFISGYGSLNAFNSMQTIKANHFIEDAITQNGIKNFPLVIPSNCKQVKVTMAWTDTVASANAAKALVNDIDALLLSPSGAQSWQPWVLNSKANGDSLILPAVRSRDTLNTVEQITIDDPQPGTYTLQIKGSRIITATQAFAVAYQVDTVSSFLWTYPSSSDIIKAGVKNYLRWQTNISGNGQLEYSKDGNTWQTITAAADLSKKYYQWIAPDTTTIAFLRMKVTPAFTFATDTFVISQPVQISTGFNCSDSFLLYWNKLPVNQYQLYALGDQYLQPAITSTDTFRVFQKQQFPSLYYAVAPRSSTRMGLRSYTINYTTQGAGCYIVSFFSVLQNANEALLSLTLGTPYNVAEISFQKLIGNVFQTIQTFSPTAVSQNFTDVHLMEGVNRYRAKVKLNNGLIIYSDEDQVVYFPHQPVIVYPNPAPASQPIKIIVKDQGIYSIRLFDAIGRRIKEFDLNDILTTIPSFTLPKGIYFIQVTSNANQLFTQKLAVQ